jgi:hypothetical protein
VAITSGFPVVGTLTRDSWHHFDVVLDYVSQTFTLKLDGSTLATDLPFCGSNSGCTGAPVAEFGWALFNTFGNGNDSGYMDNFSIAEAGATAPILNPENGHYYKFVAARNITWAEAEIAAAGRSFHGEQGYLATVTSASKQAFIESLLSTFTFRQLDNIWLGGNDPAGNGVWFWATGPETGMQFWQGGVTGRGERRLH